VYLLKDLGGGPDRLQVLREIQDGGVVLFDDLGGREGGRYGWMGGGRYERMGMRKGRREGGRTWMRPWRIEVFRSWALAWGSLRRESSVMPVAWRGREGGREGGRGHELNTIRGGETC